jgi:tetratricopeptide (TPR) repeat protein
MARSMRDERSSWDETMQRRSLKLHFSSVTLLMILRPRRISSSRHLRLNPNSSRAWDVSASISLYRGEHPRALEHFERARRLNPLDPAIFWIDAGHAAALVFSGRYEEALALLQKALSQQPKFAIPLRLLIIALVGLGRLEQARKAVEELRRLDPSISLSALMQVLPFQRPADLAFYSNAMRMAGLPE